MGRAAAELRPGRDRARDRGGTHESCHVGVRARRSGAGRRAGGATGGRVSRPSVDAAASWRASAASRRKSSISKTRSANQRAERRLPSESSPRIPAARDVRHRDRKITPPSPRVAARRTARRGDARGASRGASVTHPLALARPRETNERGDHRGRDRPRPEVLDGPPPLGGATPRRGIGRRPRGFPLALPGRDAIARVRGLPLAPLARPDRPRVRVRSLFSPPRRVADARRVATRAGDPSRGSSHRASPRWPPPRSPPRGRARSPPPLGSARASRAGASRARRPSPARRSNLATARVRVARAAPRDPPMGPRAPPWAGRKQTGS